MRIYDVIEKKTQHGELSKEELQFFVDGLCSGGLPDYQASALIMAIFLNGMTERETADLTAVMAHSGDMIDLTGIEGIKVDKHSSGGVGDKTTLIIGPIIAACGGKMAKMSGRALGNSGGTIDKLESIPGFNVALSKEEFIRNVNRLGVAVTGQTANVAPADKKIYALRDVTATVASVPLIASSIMSKKLASGADAIVLDVKAGSGAFVKSPEEARTLAALMVEIGERNGKPTTAFITNMDRPLGRCVGNLLEVQEAAETLQGNGPEDLTGLCLSLAAEMLRLAGFGSFQECRENAAAKLRDGSAAAVFRQFIEAQGGDAAVIEHPERYYPNVTRRTVTADKAGYLTIRSTEEVGRSSMMLGAGRETKEDTIDYAAGIRFLKTEGEHVEAGEAIYELFAGNAGKIPAAEELMKENVYLAAVRPPEKPLIYDKIFSQRQ